MIKSFCLFNRKLGEKIQQQKEALKSKATSLSIKLIRYVIEKCSNIREKINCSTLLVTSPYKPSHRNSYFLPVIYLKCLLETKQMKFYQKRPLPRTEHHISEKLLLKVIKKKFAPISFMKFAKLRFL